MGILVIVLRHGDGEPVFHFLKCKAGGFVAVVAPALAYVGECRPRQAMHEAHQRADHPLDHAAEVWAPRRAPFDGDAVLGAAALKCLGMELGSVVHAEPARLALHRPA